MAEVSVGTAKITLAMDSSSMETVLDRVRQRQQGLGQVAQQEADKMTVASRRTVNSLERQARTIGLNREELVRYRIMTQTTGETQRALLKTLDDNTRALERQGTVMGKTVNEVNKYGLTGKQQVAAMRQVPAQMTDIFVSLQGGQRPMTVLIQQGGQLKDVFGGVVPAAKALGAQVMAMINPLSVAAVMLAGVGFAAYQGSKEMGELDNSLIRTGRRAGVTSSELADMASQLGKLDGATTASASKVIAEAISTGALVGDQIQMATLTAINMQRAFGQETSDTIDIFKQLADDPVKALLDLTDKYGFLTTEQLAHVNLLVEQGRHQEASTEAMRIFSDTISGRTPEIVQNLGYIDRVAGGVKDTFKALVDAVRGLGRDPTLEQHAQRLKNYATLREAAAARGQTNSPLSPALLKREAEAQAAVVAAAMEDAFNGDTVNGKRASAALSGWKSAMEGVMPPADKLAKRLEDVATWGRAIGKSADDIKKLQDALVAQDAAKGNKDGNSLANAASKAGLQAIKDAETVQRAEIANTGKVLQAEYSARIVTEQAYFNQRRELAQRDFQVQEQSLLQQIEHLRQRSVAGKDAVTNSQELGKAEAALAKIRSDHATQQVVLGIQEDALTNKRQRALDAYGESLELSNRAAEQSVQSQLLKIMHGQREAEQLEQMAALTDQYADAQRRLARELAETNDEDMYREKLRLLKEWMDEQVRIVQDGYAQIERAEANWRNGMNTGLRNWMDGAANVAKQTEAITVNALNGTVDMLTTFAMTSKLTWRTLLADIGEQIVRFMMQQAVLQFLQYFMGMYAGSTGSVNLATSTIGGSSAVDVGPQAKGGFFPGTGNLSAYSGTVVNQPTPFYFAKGAGVMGEAGMEGIFPLQRGADGKLGVKAVGGGMSAPIYITTNVHVADGGVTSDTQTAGDGAAMFRDLAGTMSNVAKQEIIKAKMPGGILWKAGA